MGKEPKKQTKQEEIAKANIEMDKKFYGDDGNDGFDMMFDVGETTTSVIFDEIQNDVRQG